MIKHCATFLTQKKMKYNSHMTLSTAAVFAKTGNPSEKSSTEKLSLCHLHTHGIANTAFRGKVSKSKKHHKCVPHSKKGLFRFIGFCVAMLKICG